ncbi:hypothetical protein [Bordetella hinzii]|uniref:hypothetical protein n=1 Tax=Bordetella hinzii TaxID=103855 RepID=UPI0039FD0AE2
MPGASGVAAQNKSKTKKQKAKSKKQKAKSKKQKAKSKKQKNKRPAIACGPWYSLVAHP